MPEDCIVEALVNEHRIVTQLINTVKSVVAVVPQVNRDTWLTELRQVFGRFRVHLKQHIKGEEAEGFMGPVLDRRPTLSAEVQHLKREHIELAKWLDGIWDELSAVGPDDHLLIGDTCHRIENMVSAVEHHEEREELLVTFVFSQDIGG